MYTVGLDAKLRTSLGYDYDYYFDCLRDVSKSLLEKTLSVRSVTHEIAVAVSKVITTELDVLVDVADDCDIPVRFIMIVDVRHGLTVNMNLAKTIYFHVDVCEPGDYPGSFTFHFKNQLH